MIIVLTGWNKKCYVILFTRDKIANKIFSVSKRFYIKHGESLTYGPPSGMINDILSANSPQLTLFNWKIVTHVTSTVNQSRDPIVEKITSENHTGNDL